MNTFARVALAVLSLAASPALAENEGNGTPFPYAAEARVSSGSVFVTETWSQSHPQFTGNGTQASSLAGLLPSGGSETPVMTANSLPVRAVDGMVAYAGLRRRVPVTVTQIVVSNNQAQHLAYGAAVARR
ncbi:MAG TPA: hypothetical protein VGC15_25020 [Acetobacteraceae bacterium]